MDRFIIRGVTQRDAIKRMADEAAVNTVVEFKEMTRTIEQNSRMWVMLADISKAEPRGLKYIADDWKIIMMRGAGWEVQFLDGLDGKPFPTGFRSSRMTVRQMSDLISYMLGFGAEEGVQWSEPHPDERNR